MLDRETRSWFSQMAQRDPLWLENSYLPAVEKLIEKYHAQLHQADRNGTLEEVRYAKGRLDGAAESLALLCGLRSAETRKPVSPGLLASIFSFGGASSGKV